MAHVTGTATDAADLYAKLLAFLTTDATLVAAGQNWTTVWDTPAPTENQSDVMLRGPGLSGQDQIYVGLRLHEDSGADQYWIELAGATGVLAAAEHYRDHVNPSTNYVRTFLDGAPMQYWFTASGRRFIVVVRISTTYEAMYAGFFLPYGTPVSYPYPMFIGGTACGQAQGVTDPSPDVNGPFSWRDINDNHSMFTDPYAAVGTGSGAVDSSAWMIAPDGVWHEVHTQGSVPTHTIWPPYSGGDYFASQNNSLTYHADRVLTNMRDAYGGDRAVVPYTLLQIDPDDQTYGILDGVFRCQGFANAAENIITKDGDDLLVVQNVYRSGFDNYMCVSTE